MCPEPLITSADKKTPKKQKVSSSAAALRGASHSLLLEGREGDVGHAVNNSSLRPLHRLSSCGMAHIRQDEYEGSL